ncbi:hypothetical protein PG984_002445 [Apiospora sp. TS-2023a]
MAPPQQQQQKGEHATDEDIGSVSTPDRLPQAKFGRQRALRGVVVEGTPDFYLRSVLADEEAYEHEMVVAETHPEMLPSLLSAPPTVPLDKVPGDQTRPMFTVASDDSDDNNSSGTLTPSILDDQNGDGGEDDDEDEEEAEVGTEEERRWRLSERREKAAHAARVAVADQCFHPRPRPITRYSGPMTVVHLDRMAALMDFQTEENEAHAEEAGQAMEASVRLNETDSGEEETRRGDEGERTGGCSEGAMVPEGGRGSTEGGQRWWRKKKKSGTTTGAVGGEETE